MAIEICYTQKGYIVSFYTMQGATVSNPMEADKLGEYLAKFLQ